MSPHHCQRAEEQGVCSLATMWRLVAVTKRFAVVRVVAPGYRWRWQLVTMVMVLISVGIWWWYVALFRPEA